MHVKKLLKTPRTTWRHLKNLGGLDILAVISGFDLSLLLAYNRYENKKRRIS
jgi:hypothetical protein